MNVSRRADVPAYFCFFLTPKSREDIAFRKFRKKFDFFFREKFNIFNLLKYHLRYDNDVCKIYTHTNERIHARPSISGPSYTIAASGTKKLHE